MVSACRSRCSRPPSLSKALVVILPLVLVVLDVYPLRRLGGAAGWRGRSLAASGWRSSRSLPSAPRAPSLAFAARGPFGAAPDLAHFDRRGPAVTSLTASPSTSARPSGRRGCRRSTRCRSRLDLVSWCVADQRRRGRCSLRWPRWRRAGAGPRSPRPGRLRADADPRIGVVQSGPQITADRYTYLACLGWALLFGGSGRLVRGPVAAGSAAALAYGAGAVCGAWPSSGHRGAHGLPDPRVAGLGHAVDARAEARPEERRAPTRAWPARTWPRGSGPRPSASSRRRSGSTPCCPEALMGIALVRSKAGRGPEALEYATRAIRLVPHDASAYRFLAEVYGNAGQREAELAAYRQAIALDPRSPILRYAVAVRLAEADRTQEAVAAARGGRRTGPGVGFSDHRTRALRGPRLFPGRPRAIAGGVDALPGGAQPDRAPDTRAARAESAGDGRAGELDRPASRRTP